MKLLNKTYSKIKAIVVQDSLPKNGEAGIAFFNDGSHVSVYVNGREHDRYLKTTLTVSELEFIIESLPELAQEEAENETQIMASVML